MSTSYKLLTLCRLELMSTRSKMFVTRYGKLSQLLSLRSLTRSVSTEAFNFETYTAINEPMHDYAPGTLPREKLEETLQSYEGRVKDCPIVIGDEEIRTNDVRYHVSPFDKNRQVAKYYYADKELIQKAIQNSMAARKEWERTPLAKRAEVFIKAADLMAEKYRYDLLATTMIGQGKNIWQAEIDAAAELIDFLRFNVQFAREMTAYQPLSPNKTQETNTLRYRGLEGFWAAITPFNFTAIGGHLCSAPALMGNVCLWKPSDTAVLSNYTVYNIYREAGLPAGVINFVTADGPNFGNTITASPHLAGINFTGSVKMSSSAKVKKQRTMHSNSRPACRFVWATLERTAVPWPAEVKNGSLVFVKSDNAILLSYAGKTRSLDDIDESLVGELTEVEKFLLKSQDLMKVRGKGNRPVPVIIPKDVQEPLDFIASRDARRAAGILDENVYLFPLAPGLNPARSYDSLKKICAECSLVAPCRITSVSMRKYTATLTQMLNLDNNEMEWVCQHLGHTGNIHKTHYRQISGFIERVHVTKMFLLQDMNMTQKFRGKKLEEIDLSDIVFPDKSDETDDDDNKLTDAIIDNFPKQESTFKTLQKMVAQNLDIYKCYPRLMGECGGKNMHFVHKSANPENVIFGSILSGFEFSGQKCSALSRMYVPESMWPKIKDGMLKIHKEIKLGSVLDGETFLSAVIDDKSFARNKAYLDHAKSSDNLTVVAGGHCDDSTGYFVEPTIIETKDPEDKIMKEEIFGPIVTVYPYPDDDYLEIAKLANETSPFALTGAIYSEDKKALDELIDVFHDAAGNLYINEKSTGSVVGQQPFGGARMSGTNDKAGGPFYLLKFVSPQSVETRHVPRSTWKYPSMAPNVKITA